MAQTPCPADEGLQQGAQHHHLVLTRQALEILVIQIPGQQFVLADAAQLLRMLPHLPHHGGGVATEHLRPQQDEAAKVQTFDHARPGQQAHHRLQLRQFDILPAQCHLHPLFQLGQADQHQAAVAQAQDFLLQPMVERRRRCLRDAPPINGLHDGFAELVATFPGLRARLMQQAEEAAFRHELLHAGGADHKTAASNARGGGQLGKRFPRRLLEVAIPMTQRLKQAPALLLFHARQLKVRPQKLSELANGPGNIAREVLHELRGVEQPLR